MECLKNYGQRFVTLYMRQGSRPSPRKRNATKQNGCLGGGGLTNSCENKRSEGKVEKERSECRVPKNSKDKKAFLSNQRKEIDENNRIGKTRDLFKKIRDTQATLCGPYVGNLKKKGLAFAVGSQDGVQRKR